MYFLDNTPYGRAFCDQMGFLITPEEMLEALQKTKTTYSNPEFAEYVRRYNAQRMWDYNQTSGPPPYPELSENPERVERYYTGEKEKKTRRKYRGYVYLMRGGNGEYKIGLSRDPDSRAVQHENASGISMEILHTIPSDDMQVDERYLLDLYADKCLHGEWFALMPADVDHICSLTQTDLKEARDGN